MAQLIQNDALSARPMSVPDANDVAILEARRLKLAKSIEEQERLCRAKESTIFGELVMDSYRSMQMTERAIVLLDPNKPGFILNFAMLQGRWRERMVLTEELMYGKRDVIRKKSLLERIAAKLKVLTANLR